MKRKFIYYIVFSWLIGNYLYISNPDRDFFHRRIKSQNYIKPRRIGFVITRIGGKDGVSEEALHWMRILKKDGHHIYVFTGENENPQRLEGLVKGVYISEGSALSDSSNQDILKTVFEYKVTIPEDVLIDFIYTRKDEIKVQLLDFIRENHIEVLIVENALSLPVQIPLALALKEVISETGIKVIARHHDFYWEGGREESFKTLYPHIAVMLDELFPPDLPIVHITINSITQENLRERGINSQVIPNCFFYGDEIQEISEQEKQKLRELLGIKSQDRILLVPTRAVRRKNIELAIEIAGDLHSRGYDNLKLIVSLAVEDQKYREKLERLAEAKNVDLIFAYDMLADSEFSPWDIFRVSDLVIIPSRWEGFGNNLLEAIAYRKPIVVYSYPVLESDILPKGFNFITVSEDKSNLPQVVQTIETILNFLTRNGRYPRWIKEAIEYNYNLANQVFSYTQIGDLLRTVISSLP